MFVDLPLIAIDRARQDFLQRHLATCLRRFEHGKGTGEIVQPFHAAGLRVFALFNGLQPVELLNDIGISEAKGEELGVLYEDLGAPYLWATRASMRIRIGEILEGEA